MDRVKWWNWYVALLAVALLGTAGCPSTKDSGQKAAKRDQKKDASHAEQAPHGGTLFADEGDKHHAELVLDKAGKKATVYLLDGKVKNAVPIGEKTITVNIADNPPVQITLQAEPQKEDKTDTASRFSGIHDRLGNDLDMDKVEIEAKINGKPFVFKVDKD